MRIAVGTLQDERPLLSAVAVVTIEFGAMAPPLLSVS